MGVKCKRRAEHLCTDSATLDAVIYDACVGMEQDYVVTMQPTSPTLLPSTLDAAIKHCIDEDLDTVISVINNPHLSWSEKDGQKVPNYKERLNRQYLPPYYLETGAFLISRASIVTEKTRIGHNVDVFEISQPEAIDVDTFADLKYVESVLSSQKVAFMSMVIMQEELDIFIVHLNLQMSSIQSQISTMIRTRLILRCLDRRHII